jgi:hypothetical protein
VLAFADNIRELALEPGESLLKRLAEVRCCDDLRIGCQPADGAAPEHVALPGEVGDELAASRAWRGKVPGGFDSQFLSSAG